MYIIILSYAIKLEKEFLLVCKAFINTLYTSGQKYTNIIMKDCVLVNNILILHFKNK